MNREGLQIHRFYSTQTHILRIHGRYMSGWKRAYMTTGGTTASIMPTKSSVEPACAEPMSKRRRR